MIALKRATPEAVKYACLNFHYARQVPNHQLSYNVYNEGGEWCGCILFGNGREAFGRQFGFSNGEFLELVRVALNGKQPCTSECVAVAMRRVKKDAPAVKMLLSYADTEQGHFGTIYQATNWIYLGESKGARYFIVKGRRMHSTTCGSNGWKCNISWLRQNVDPKAQEIQSWAKRKYVYFFDKKLRKQWQAKALPYPKKHDNTETSERTGC